MTGTVTPSDPLLNQGMHFISKVYRKFCESMSIKLEFPCHWWPQSSGNIKWQHHRMKNVLFMLYKERNYKWTNVLKSVTSSINATVNNATGVSPHITGCHHNIFLPNDDAGAYDMQIKTLLRQVPHYVTLAYNKANYKLEASLNCLTISWWENIILSTTNKHGLFLISILTWTI